jgi:hypothetical protein
MAVLGASLALGPSIVHLKTQMEMNVRARSKIDSLFLKTALQMSLSNPTVCASSLSAGGFGTNLSGLSGKTVSVSYKGPTGPQTLQVGSRYNQLSIVSIAFSSAVQVFTGESSYLADLKIGVQGNATEPNTVFTIPFYFTTDANGAFTGCFATSYPAPTETYLTLEDLICANDGTKIYRPIAHYCDTAPANLGTIRSTL